VLLGTAVALLPAARKRTWTAYKNDKILVLFAVLRLNRCWAAVPGDRPRAPGGGSATATGWVMPFHLSRPSLRTGGAPGPLCCCGSLLALVGRLPNQTRPRSKIETEAASLLCCSDAARSAYGLCAPHSRMLAGALGADGGTPEVHSKTKWESERFPSRRHPTTDSSLRGCKLRLISLVGFADSSRRFLARGQGSAARVTEARRWWGGVTGDTARLLVQWR